MSTKTETARALADAFETATRDNGDKFHRLRDGSPEWMKEAIFAAHDGGEMLPNDWSYRLCSEMADGIAERLEYDEDSDLSDAMAEIAEGAVPAYTHERLAWLSSHLHRLEMVDEAIAEAGGISGTGQGIADALGWAMFREAESIGAALVEAIEGEAGE